MSTPMTRIAAALVAIAACGGPKDSSTATGGATSGATTGAGAAGPNATGATAGSSSSSTASSSASGGNCALLNNGNNCECHWFGGMPACIAQDGKCQPACPSMPCCVHCKQPSYESCQCGNVTGKDCDVTFLGGIQATCPGATKVGACP